MKTMLVQSVLPEEVIIKLKMKSGQATTKDAISIAVYHYLECEKVE